MKEFFYKVEDFSLNQYAVKSKDTKGRQFPSMPCDLRTEFQRDRDRITHSKSFRRLKHKTQVFLSPEGDHYRTRLTHTLEVTQIARTIARCLRLNEDLVEAISLGHDLGHTPFGHSGENILNKLNPSGFKHNEHSLRVVDLLENDGEGLNLTFEVRDGILHHRKNGNSITLEGKIVSYADRIAYINHDIEDAISAKLLTENEIPKELSKYLGNSKSKRISFLIQDIVSNSYDKDYVSLSKSTDSAMEELRSFMFSKVYFNELTIKEDSKALRMLTALFNYYLDDPTLLPKFNQSLIEKWGIHQAITDYLASMSDRYVITLFENIYIPTCWV